jgi:nucleoside-diphosphate-sugar epimerase
MTRIIVAGANGKVGRLLVPRLAAAGHEVIALVRTEPVPQASRCLTDWMNARLPDAEPDDVVVNLTGDINPPGGDYERANTRTAERLRLHYDGRAAHALFIGFPGASTISANRYLRTKAEAEALTLATARAATILRTVYICGTPDSPQESDLRQQTPKGRAARCFGNGRSRYRPLLIDDVVRAILTCIDRSLPGAFALEGKEVLSSDQIIRLLNRDPDKAIRHFPRRLARAIGPMIGITRDFVDILIEDQLCTDPNVFDVCGVVPGSVRQAWR